MHGEYIGADNPAYPCQTLKTDSLKTHQAASTWIIAASTAISAVAMHPISSAAMMTVVTALCFDSR